MHVRTCFNHLAFTAILVVLFSACSSSRPAATTAPRSLPPLPPSQINIPIRIYMKPLLAAMDSMTAKEFTSDNWPAYFQPSCDFRYRYRFIRSPFSFQCQNNRVNIAFRGQYQIAGSRSVCAFDRQVSPWVSGSCGFGSEPMRRVDINISSYLQFLPNHQVRTSTVLNKLQPLDKCQVTLLQNDMTAEILDSIRASVETYTTSFDQFVQTLNNNQTMTELRSGGSRVFPVSQYGFLNLNPSAIQIGAFNYVRDSLVFSIGYTGTPEFSSDSASLVTNRPLPSLSQAGGMSVINTYLNAVYDYGFFNKILNDSLRNKPFQVEGRTFVIDNISVNGSDDGKVSLAVSFSGNRKGVLRLSGTPVLDTATQVLSMPDISFDLDTRDMLVNMAKGLLRKKILRQLKDKSVLDLAELISRNQASISARLNQPVNDWLHTSGRLNHLRIVGLLPTSRHIQLQLHINANLVLNGAPDPLQYISSN